MQDKRIKLKQLIM